MKNYIISALIIAVLLVPTIALGDLNFGNEYLTNFQNTAGYGNAGLESVVGNIIQIVLSLLGLVAVILIIIGGFKWMASGGNEEKIKDAKKLMGAAVMGLIIVVLAYAIASFVIDRLSGITE